MDDIVQCYACDGGLRKWDPMDDPWIEHAREFPNCDHVIREKGQGFIKMIQDEAKVFYYLFEALNCLQRFYCNVNKIGECNYTS